MSTISFSKMVASGNDFILIDNRKGVLSDPVPFARQACDRHRGVGADGVLLIELSKKADFKMRILNADGSEAEACGNGFRCTALFAHERLGFSKVQRFETPAGLVEAAIEKGRVRVRMTDPKDFKEREKIQIAGRELHYFFIRSGVPHAVIFVEGLSKISVPTIGREIRYHEVFKPAGTNVNFVEVLGPQLIEVRTYERGVEDETLACGTGSVASAVVSAKLGYTQSPVSVKTRGGETLRVDLKIEKDSAYTAREVYLEGGARFVFEGKFDEK